MPDPFVFNVNNPKETAESIAGKLNARPGILDVEAVRDAVSTRKLMEFIGEAKADLKGEIEKASGKAFSHVEATYARTAGTRKMSDLRYHGGGTPITVSLIAPSNPKQGDLWLDIN